MEDCKKQYEDNHQKYDELMKTYQKRKATPEDTELIKNLLKDH